MEVAADRAVTIDYTVKNTDGEVIDSSEGREPLVYLHGRGDILPALESALDGKAPGDQMDIHLSADEAYGKRDESLVLDVDKSVLNGLDDLEVGTRFRADTPQGSRIFTITDIEGEQVTIDGNHPLAGLPLDFHVEVKDVREATPEEIEHGHVHGEDGEVEEE